MNTSTGLYSRIWLSCLRCAEHGHDMGFCDQFLLTFEVISDLSFDARQGSRLQWLTGI